MYICLQYILYVTHDSIVESVILSKSFVSMASQMLEDIRLNLNLQEFQYISSKPCFIHWFFWSHTAGEPDVFSCFYQSLLSSNPLSRYFMLGAWRLMRIYIYIYVQLYSIHIISLICLKKNRIFEAFMTHWFTATKVLNKRIWAKLSPKTQIYLRL